MENKWNSTLVFTGKTNDYGHSTGPLADSEHLKAATILHSYLFSPVYSEDFCPFTVKMLLWKNQYENLK